MRSLQPSRRRRAARWTQLILAAGLIGAALAQAEAAAQVPNEPEIIPRLECVARNDDGSLTAKFGWENRSGRTIRPQALENQIIPPKYQRLVKTEFAPGKVTTKNGGFTITFGESEKLTWKLLTEQVEASAASTPCPPDQRVPATTVAATTTTAINAAGSARSGGPPQAPRGAPTSLPPVLAADQGEGSTGSFGLAEVIPALVLGLLVLGTVAFGMESAGRRLRS